MKINLMEIIRTTPAKSFVGIGPIVTFSDLYEALRANGADDQYFLEAKLIELEKQNLVRIYRDESDLVIGVHVAHTSPEAARPQ